MSPPIPYAGWIFVIVLILVLGTVVGIHLLATPGRMNQKSDRRFKVVLVLTPLLMILLYLFVLRPALYGFLMDFYRVCPELPNIDAYVDLSLSFAFIAIYVLIWQDVYLKKKEGGVHSKA